MNSITNTKNTGRAMKMNFNNNKDSKTVIKMTETINHIKEIFKNPFSFLFGMKKVIDNLLYTVTQNFAKLFNKKN